MKALFFVLTVFLSLNIPAHEGGHGSVAEGGKFGGVTSPVVAASEAGKGEKAQTLYKAELVRAASGKLSLYIFDVNMKLVSPDRFKSEVEAKLEVKKKGKFTYFGNFKLTKNGNHFNGQLPKVEYKPFNIDLFLFEGDKKLFSGFSNLD